MLHPIALLASVATGLTLKQTFPGAGMLLSLAASQDQSTLVTGGKESVVRVYSLASGTYTLVNSIQGSGDWITALSLDQSSQKLIVGYYNHSFAVYNSYLTPSAPALNFAYPNEILMAAQLSNNYYSTASNLGTLRLFAYPSLALSATLPSACASSPSHIDFSPDQSKLLLTCQQRISIFDLPALSLRQTIYLPSDCYSAAFSGNGQYITAASSLTYLHVYKLTQNYYSLVQTIIHNVGFSLLSTSYSKGRDLSFVAGDSSGLLTKYSVSGGVYLAAVSLTLGSPILRLQITPSGNNVFALEGYNLDIISDCSSYYYPYGSICLACQQANPVCLACSSPTTCLGCLAGYSALAGDCWIDCSLKPFAAVSINKSTCSCVAGYLWVKGECVLNCGAIQHAIPTSSATSCSCDNLYQWQPTKSICSMQTSIQKGLLVSAGLGIVSIGLAVWLFCLYSRRKIKEVNILQYQEEQVKDLQIQQGADALQPQYIRKTVSIHQSVTEEQYLAPPIQTQPQPQVPVDLKVISLIKVKEGKSTYQSKGGLMSPKQRGNNAERQNKNEQRQINTEQSNKIEPFKEATVARPIQASDQKKRQQKSLQNQKQLQVLQKPKQKQARQIKPNLQTLQILPNKQRDTIDSKGKATPRRKNETVEQNQPKIITVRKRKGKKQIDKQTKVEKVELSNDNKQLGESGAKLVEVKIKMQSQPLKRQTNKGIKKQTTKGLQSMGQQIGRDLSLVQKNNLSLKQINLKDVQVGMVLSKQTKLIDEQAKMVQSQKIGIAQNQSGVSITSQHSPAKSKLERAGQILVKGDKGTGRNQMQNKGQINIQAIEESEVQQTKLGGIAKARLKQSSRFGHSFKEEIPSPLLAPSSNLKGVANLGITGSLTARDHSSKAEVQQRNFKELSVIMGVAGSRKQSMEVQFMGTQDGSLSVEITKVGTKRPY